MDNSDNYRAKNNINGVNNCPELTDQEVPRKESFSEMNGFYYQRQEETGTDLNPHANFCYPPYVYDCSQEQMHYMYDVKAEDVHPSTNETCYQEPFSSTPYYSNGEAYGKKILNNYFVFDQGGHWEQLESTLTILNQSERPIHFTGAFTQQWSMEQPSPFSCPPRIESETLNAHEPFNRYAPESWTRSREHCNQFLESDSFGGGAGYIQTDAYNWGCHVNTHAYPEASSAPPLGSTSIAPPKRYKTKPITANAVVNILKEKTQISDNLSSDRNKFSEWGKLDVDYKRKRNKESVRKHRCKIAQYIENGPSTIAFLNCKSRKMDDLNGLAQKTVEDLMALINSKRLLSNPSTLLYSTSITG